MLKVLLVQLQVLQLDWLDALGKLEVTTNHTFNLGLLTLWLILFILGLFFWCFKQIWLILGRLQYGCMLESPIVENLFWNDAAYSIGAKFGAVVSRLVEISHHANAKIYEYVFLLQNCI